MKKTLIKSIVIGVVFTVGIPGIAFASWWRFAHAPKAFQATTEQMIGTSSQPTVTLSTTTSSDPSSDQKLRIAIAQITDLQQQISSLKDKENECESTNANLDQTIANLETSTEIPASTSTPYTPPVNCQFYQSEKNTIEEQAISEEQQAYSTSLETPSGPSGYDPEISMELSSLNAEYPGCF